MLDGNFSLVCGPGPNDPYIHIFQCMLERTNAITNEVLEPITLFPVYPTVHQHCCYIIYCKGNVTEFAEILTAYMEMAVFCIEQT
jgi:hypothetical protein